MSEFEQNLVRPTSWEREAREMTKIPLNIGEALETLELNHIDIHAEVLNSVAHSEWVSIDNGRMILEIRDNFYTTKNNLPIKILDFDDCLMRTTTWHNNEYDLINTNPELISKGMIVPIDKAKEIYEMSKILIPGKADQEPRYTPRLNFILLSQFAYFLSEGYSVENAMEITKSVLKVTKETILTKGDNFLLKKPIDSDILSAIQSNSPKKYLYTKFVSELFQHSKDNLNIIVSRGKPEGLLGQVYKIHSSGVLEYPVDLVLYTNDIKAEALVVLSKIIPSIKTAPVEIYDDNPSEVLPYLKFFRERNINNIKIVHVRHVDAKRKNIPVGENPISSRTDDETQTIFDVYHPNNKTNTV